MLDVAKATDTELEFSNYVRQALLEIMSDYLLQLKMSETSQSTRTTLPTCQACVWLDLVYSFFLQFCAALQDLFAFVSNNYASFGSLPESLMKRCMVMEEPKFMQKLVKLTRCFVTQKNVECCGFTGSKMLRFFENIVLIIPPLRKCISKTEPAS